MTYVASSCVVGLLAVFSMSAVGKLVKWQDFLASLDGVVPDSLSRLVASGITGAELIIVTLLAVSLIAPNSRPLTGTVACALGVALLVLFIGGLSYMIRHDIRRACYCFGRAGSEYSPIHIVRNVCLFLMAACGLLGIHSYSGATPDELITAGSVGIAAGFLVTRLDDVVDVVAMTFT